MNKIRKCTYLYNRIDSYIKEMGLKDVIITYEDKCKAKKYILYMLEPMLIDNIHVYNKLFKDEWEYIFYGNLNILQFDNCKYINILTIGKKYKIYTLFRDNISQDNIKYIINYIAIMISNEIVINKVSNINNGFKIIDIALEKGKDIYSIPGNIFEHDNYLANYLIKHGSIPICDISDIKYILLQKDYKKI